MTSLAIELTGSRRGQSASDRSTEIELYFLVTGHDLMTTAVEAVLAGAPALYYDPVYGIALSFCEILWEPVARDKWRFTCRYIDPSKEDETKQLQTGEWSISFDTTGATAKVTTSLETVHSYTADPADPAQDYKGAIGVTGERDVEGCEKITPQQRFTISYRHPKAVITSAYAATLETLTGTVNDSVFFGRPAGEILFCGASGKQGSSGDPTIDYHFMRMPNLYSQTVGGIDFIDKRGWDYLWFAFKDKKLANFISRTPRWAYVERIYQESDFTLLGIGTGT